MSSIGFFNSSINVCEKAKLLIKLYESDTQSPMDSVRRQAISYERLAYVFSNQFSVLHLLLDSLNLSNHVLVLNLTAGCLDSVYLKFEGWSRRIRQD